MFSTSDNKNDEGDASVGNAIFKHFKRTLSGNSSVEAINFDLMIMSTKGKSASARIDYVYKMMTEYNLLPDVASLEELKSDAKSEGFRTLGNTYYSARPPKYVLALEEYNKSLCFAVSKENVSTAISNRSAVFLMLKMYPECLESIRLAREYGVPEKLKEKLSRREEMCRDRMKSLPPKEEVVPEIGMPVNEKIPFIAKCLALRENDKFGKHIVTEDAIPVGTIIAIEEPYCRILKNSEKYLRCATCLLEVPHLLFPCENCTQTMFCSKGCKEKALKEFHAIECPISGSLFKLINSRSLLSFRTCVKFMLAFSDTKTMFLALQKIDKEKKNVFNFDWNHKLSPEDLYAPIYTLICNEDKLSETYLRSYVEMCLMFKLLKNSPIFCQRYLTTTAAKNIVQNFIYRNIVISYWNGKNLQHGFINNVSIECVYGCAVGGFYNLINHSCCPNTKLISIGSTFGILTIKNIAAGEQIFHAYGVYHHVYTEKCVRQKEIFEDYGFHCECLACVGDLPVWDNLAKPNNIPRSFLHNISLLECTCRCLVATSKKISQKACKFIEKYEHLNPCKQLVFAKEELSNSFELMYNSVPFRLRDAPKCPKCQKRNF